MNLFIYENEWVNNEERYAIYAVFVCVFSLKHACVYVIKLLFTYGMRMYVSY